MCFKHNSVYNSFFIFFFFNALVYNACMGHIGCADKTMISEYSGQWFKYLVVPICCDLEQDTLSTLLLSTQLTNDYQTGTSM